MLTRCLSVLLALGAPLLLTSNAEAFQRRGDNNELKIAEPAPPLPSMKWIGERPDLNTPKVTLVYFWEPSYTGTRLAMPILSQLQQRWGNDRLQVIGFGIEKRPKNYNEDPIPTVEPFVLKQGPRIKFPNAVVQESDVSRSWLRKRKSPFSLVVVLNEANHVQGIMSPLDEDLNELVAKLISGRYEISMDAFAAPYRVELENYRRNRDWSQYRLVLTRLTEKNPKFFADEELEFLVSALTEQDDPALARGLVDRWLMTRSQSDPDFLGMLAERLSNDPKIADDRRMLTRAAMAAKASYEAAETSEAKARAMGRMALVNVRQGNDALAREQAKKAYRIAPSHIKSELKEHWLYVKQNTDDGP